MLIIASQVIKVRFMEYNDSLRTLFNKTKDLDSNEKDKTLRKKNMKYLTLYVLYKITTCL